MGRILGFEEFSKQYKKLDRIYDQYAHRFDKKITHKSDPVSNVKYDSSYKYNVDYNHIMLWLGIASLTVGIISIFVMILK